MDSDTDSMEESVLKEYEQETKQETKKPTNKKEKAKGSNYVGIHSISFRDFLLKPEILHAISDYGFEHPSQVQQDCIPQALMGTDVICQGRSGMGKTAVFVLSVLHQIDPDPEKGEISCLVIAHTKELVYQICQEFDRFSKYLPNIKSAVFYGGIDKEVNLRVLKQQKPSIVISTPGRCKDLLNHKEFDVSKLSFFIIDEVDKVLENEKMRKDVKEIFKKLPKEKQVMLFTATLNNEMKAICKEFTRNAIEVLVDDDKKLTLHGIQQYYVKLTDNEKIRQVVQIFEKFEYKQAVIFVNKCKHASLLCKLLSEDCHLGAIVINSRMSVQDRLTNFNKFKSFQYRILVATDVAARGLDVERVNIVINFDLPEEVPTYLHRVGRAGRFGTKGLAISFVASQEDENKIECYSGKIRG